MSAFDVSKQRWGQGEKGRKGKGWKEGEGRKERKKKERAKP